MCARTHSLLIRKNRKNEKLVFLFYIGCFFGRIDEFRKLKNIKSGFKSDLMFFYLRCLFIALFISYIAFLLSVLDNIKKHGILSI